MGSVKGLAVSGAGGGGHLHDPAGADPGLMDVLRGLLGKQRPVDVAAVADLMIRCHKRDVPLSLGLAAYGDFQESCHSWATTQAA
jgi:hypothetical protein